MDRKQADAIAQAILEPDLKAQDALVHQRAAKAAKLAQQRRHAWFGLAGFVIGHFAFGRVSYGGLIGLLVGKLVGVLVGRISRRLPTPQA